MNTSLLGAVLSALAFFSLAACHCWKRENLSDPKCLVAHQTIDCSIEAIKHHSPGLLPVLNDLLNGDSIDWATVEKRLMAMGIADAGCILAALEKDFVTLRHPSIRREDRASRIAGIIARFKLRNHTAGKRFRIRLSDGKAVIE